MHVLRPLSVCSFAARSLSLALPRQQFGRWLLLLSLLAQGCAQAALDADSGLYDMTDPELDAGAEASIVDAAEQPDAEIGLDAGAPDAAITVDASSRDAGVDAPAVEAGADAGSQCIPGTYKGKFGGTITIIGLIKLDITGDVTIEVATNSTGDKLVLNNGKIVGKDQDDNPVEATVSGTLNCATGNLESGKLENGKYTRPVTGTVNFSGTATAKYTPNPPSAVGTWKTNSGLESGSGTWDAALVTP